MPHKINMHGEVLVFLVVCFTPRKQQLVLRSLANFFLILQCRSKYCHNLDFGPKKSLRKNCCDPLGWQRWKRDGSDDQNPAPNVPIWFQFKMLATNFFDEAMYEAAKNMFAFISLGRIREFHNLPKAKGRDRRSPPLSSASKLLNFKDQSRF